MALQRSTAEIISETRYFVLNTKNIYEENSDDNFRSVIRNRKRKDKGSHSYKGKEKAVDSPPSSTLESETSTLEDWNFDEPFEHIVTKSKMGESTLIYKVTSRNIFLLLWKFFLDLRKELVDLERVFGKTVGYRVFMDKHKEPYCRLSTHYTDKAFKSLKGRFQGIIETDGVGVSVLKQNTDTNRKSAKHLECQDDLVQQASKNSFRKMKFSSKLYYDQNDLKLIFIPNVSINGNMKRTLETLLGKKILRQKDFCISCQYPIFEDYSPFSLGKKVFNSLLKSYQLF
ncbi:hypothetical protein BDF21DRAFT_404122 [Thamnidium elegans]|nr:hypothetical protein BDF21DRAFT_404122 [Thamnidium elegans]